jgi:hypothetical protein
VRRSFGTVTRFASLLLAANLTGSELGSRLAWHPALDRLPPRSRLLAEQAAYARLGRIMPALMSSTLASGALATLATRDGDRAALALRGASCASYAAMLAITLTATCRSTGACSSSRTQPRARPSWKTSARAGIGCTPHGTCST